MAKFIKFKYMVSRLPKKPHRATIGTQPFPVTQSQQGRTPQLETIFPITVFSPDKEAVQAAPQKLAQI